ncbi:MAG: hypothetical protein AAF771_01645 [Pseudomonadota bacterium]
MSDDQTPHLATVQARAALIALIVLQVVMLLSLYSQTPPHPPLTVAPFAIAPFLGAALALAAVSLMLGPVEHMAGRVTGVLAVLAALVSYGPQKYIDAQIALIWPSVLAGQIAALAFAHALWAARQRNAL